MHRNIKLTPILDSIQFIEMSDEEYFSSKWSEYISNSRLALINPEQDGSPEKYLEGLSENGKYSDSLYFGSCVHELVLQPESFELEFGIDRPTAKAGLMADELYKVYTGKDLTKEQIIAASDKVDYYKGKMDEKKIAALLEKIMPYVHSRWYYESTTEENGKESVYLDPKGRAKLVKCLDSVRNNKDIQALLHPMGMMEPPLSMNEAALFMDVKAELDGTETILKLKGKLDNFTWDYETGELVLNDLKTTGHLLIDFKDSFVKYHYARQMAMYMYMLRLWCEKENGVKPSTSKANMLLISTVPDFLAGVYKVKNSQIAQGFKEFKDLLQRVALLQLNA